MNDNIVLKYKLEIKEFSDPLSNDIFHFLIQSSEDKNRISGFGTDFDRENALKKAFGEFFEIRGLKEANKEKRNFLGSGISAHFSEKLAMTHALNELIERDIFLCSWLLKIPPRWIKKDHYFVSKETHQMIEAQRSMFTSFDQVFDFKIGIIGRCMGRFIGIAILINNQKNNFILVLSSSNKINYAIKSLIYDLRRSYLVLTNGKYPTEIMKEDVIKPVDHISYYLKNGSLSSIEWMLQDQPNIEILSFPKFDYHFREVHNFKDVDFKVYSCLSDQSQNFYVGPSTLDKVNINRLRSIRPNITYDFLNKDIHPFG